MSARAGGSAGRRETRSRILEVARASFAEAGFGGTSIRKVAAAAGVDPALVHHHFGTKDDLFIAALEMPTDPRAVMAAIAEGDRETVGERLVEAFLDLRDDPDARLRLPAIVRSGAVGDLPDNAGAEFST
ncbi:MAG TPA: TetR/AcrR family transcriptional regulator [Nocardioidaceae bacterium]|nr:TetR/AcrR family transcriptional regulator [Nocardioidaceae bacterium]